MEYADLIFLFYTYATLFISSLLFFIYFSNKNNMFNYPKYKYEAVSIVMPCYNEEKEIGNAIESLLKLDWPKDMLEIIIVDDKSKDGSVKIAKKYAKKYDFIKIIESKTNSGGAARPCNIGLENSKYNYVAITDADSKPEKGILKKMIGFLQTEKNTAGVTCSVLVDKPPKTFIEKLQLIEYVVIAFSRKLLDFINAVYVTPGPFAVYKKDKLIEVGKFDEKNMTQDIEIVWALRKIGYDVRMSLAGKVYTTAPNKLKIWWKQRNRWNIGGMQTIIKHKSQILKNNILGNFILPFFSVSLFIGLIGVVLMVNNLINKLTTIYLTSQYSVYSSNYILISETVSLPPLILLYFSLALISIGIFFTYFSISNMKELKLGFKENLSVLFYFLIYLSLYPFVILSSVYKFLSGNYTW